MTAHLTRLATAAAIMAVASASVVATAPRSDAAAPAAKHPNVKVVREPRIPYTLAKPTGNPLAAAAPTSRPRKHATWPAETVLTSTPATGSDHAAQQAAHSLATVETIPAAGRTATSRSALDVTVKGQATSRALGLVGVVVTVTARAEQTPVRTTSPHALPADVKATIDYTTFANAAGAGFGPRLRMVSLPACALTTPSKPVCRERTPLDGANDGSTNTVTATVPARLATNGQLVLAAVAGPAGSSGDFTATSLAPSGSWSVAGNSGSFGWAYPLALPPAAVPDSVPSVGLSYNSAGVDGRMAGTNNQSSWVGQGWDYTPGYVERTYRSCSEDTSLPKVNQTGDLCWAGQILTVNLGGKTTAIIKDDTDGTYRLADDDGERVQRKTGTPNGARAGEYWVVTTTDGTKYHFGLHRLPGGAAADDTDSTWTVRVYGPKPGDDCYKTTGFAASRCDQAWRWNLDYIEDPHGNATALWYTPEANSYGANNKTTAVAYDRSGYLTRIEYGLRSASGSIFGAPASNRVLFGLDERCDSSAGFACSQSQFEDPAHADKWPDTPTDQHCKSAEPCDNHAPTFWSRKRLATVTTEYNTAPGATPTYQKVDKYTLASSFPGTGDPSLRLDSITRTGYAGADNLATPPTTFAYQLMDNRVEALNAQPPMAHLRLTSITSETGQVTSVSYNGMPGQSGRAPAPCTSAPTPATNTSLCYPVNWTPFGATDPILDFFHKYVVTEVTVSTQIDAAGSPPRSTTYTYKGGAAWHFDDNEVVKKKNRSWGQFRGFASVETRTGAGSTTAAQTLSTAFYYRGMDNDYSNASGSTRRTVSLTNSLGESLTDKDQYAGTAFETTTFNGDTTTLVSTSLTDPTTVATTASRARTGLDPVTARIVRTAKQRSRATKAAGGVLASTVDSTYDAEGRTIRSQDSADGAVTRCTGTTYASNASSWIRDTTSEVIQSTGACPASSSTAQSNVISVIRNYYDGASSLGSVTGNGDATRVDTARNAQGQSLGFAKSVRTFDALGRPLTQTDYVSGADTQGRTTSTAYTPANGGAARQVSITNPLTQQTSSTMDPARGSILTKVDIAGRTTSATYDPLGRLTQLWNPGRVQGTDTPSVTYAYQLSRTAPEAVTTQTWVDTGSVGSSGYRTGVVIYDASGAQRQTQTDAVEGGGSVISDALIDVHGRVAQSRTFVIAAAPGTSVVTALDSDVNERTVTTFDGAGRATLTEEFEKLVLRRSSSTAYSGDRVTTTPPTGGIQTTSIVDGRGKTIELAQWTTAPTISAAGVITGGVAQRTTYGLDALSRRTSMTASAGTPGAATWTTAYDLAGRTVSQVDPDAGPSTTTYTDTGETLTTTNAAGQTLAYTYDKLGRKTSTRTGTVTGPKVAEWEYDTLAPGTLTTSVRYNPTGTVTTAVTGYTPLGQPTGSTISVTNPVTGQPETGFLPGYTTTTSWTTTGQITGQQLAASRNGSTGLYAESLGITNNAAGLPESLFGNSAIATNIDYNGRGDTLAYSLGVNTTTAQLVYWRDPNSRAITRTMATAPVPGEFHKVDYTYDPAGNITRTVNAQGAGATPPTQTTCYTYDKLRRVSRAWSSLDACATTPGPSNSTVGGPQPFWTEWTFDTAGNRATQTNHQTPGASTPTTTTTYSSSDSSHPHALTKAETKAGATVTASTSYTNSTLGSRQAWGPTGTSPAPNTATYDVFNQTETLNIGAATVTYLNDADGNMVLRRTGTKTTLYLPSQEVTVNAGVTTTVRHYSLNGQTLATATGSGNIRYLFGDHHGTNEVAIVPTSWAISRRAFDPYGTPIGTSVGTWPDQHGFLNKPLEPTSGLTDIGARKYDPATGRFTTIDPVLAPDSPQTLDGYSYAAHNPITFSDPTGLDPALSYTSQLTTCGSASCAEKKIAAATEPAIKITFIKRNSPASDNPIDVIRDLRNGAGANPAPRDYGPQPFVVNGQNMCYYAAACDQAWKYLMSSGDVKGAKEIAALYCVGNEANCQTYDSTAEIGTNLFSLAAGAAATQLSAGGAKATPQGPSAPDAVNITTPYRRPSGATTSEQRDAVQGLPCATCGRITSRQYADHIDPLVIEYYSTGTINTTRMRSVAAVQPQCPTCSNRQGATLSRFSVQVKNLLGL